MNSAQFKSRLILIGYNQKRYANKLGISENTISTMLKMNSIPMIHQLALIGLEHQHKT